MAVGDITALEAWIAASDPHPAVVNVVGRWIARLGAEPWQAPSIPLNELSDQPVDEVRQAVVPDSGGVLVVYRQTYADGLVDLIYVGDDVET
jgi:hypothetical protein